MLRCQWQGAVELKPELIQRTTLGICRPSPILSVIIPSALRIQSRLRKNLTHEMGFLQLEERF